MLEIDLLTRQTLKQPYYWLPFLTLVTGLFLSSVVSRWHAQENQAHVSQQLGFEMRALKEMLLSDFKSYEQSLYAMRNAVIGTRHLRGFDYTGMVSSRRQAEYPGAVDFALARAGLDDQGQLARLMVSAQEREGRGDALIGRDLLTHPLVKSTVLASLNAGKATLSAPLKLADDSDEMGAYLLVPIFESDKKEASAAVQTFGWVFTRLNYDDFLLEVAPNLVEFQLEDITDKAAPLRLFATQRFAAGGMYEGSSVDREAVFNVAGRQWRLHIHPTGEFWRRLNLVSPRLSGGLGILITLLGTLSVFLLASTRHRAEAIAREMTNALRASEARFHDYSKSASDWFWETDAELRLTHLSVTDELVFGRPAADLIGKRLDEIADPDDLALTEKWNDYFNKVRQVEAFRDFETRFISRDFHHWYSLSGVPHFEADGQFAGYRGSGCEISLRKEAEQHIVKAMEAAQLASRMKSEFLANMSHEIRTPMNGVMGMITLLQQTELNPEQQEFATTAQHSAGALLSVINDILDFSKVEVGKLDLEMIDFDLRTMVEEVGDVLSFKVAEKGLDFAVFVEPNVPSRLRGDPGRLRQVLLNLAGNAVKFTEEGAVSIHLSLVNETKDKVKLRGEIIDTGIGIAQNKLSDLFSPFTQADGSTTRKYGGTGLGLSISKRLVELMGGEIGLHSDLGKGTTFWFTVSLGHGKAEQARVVPLISLKGKKILVVDDHVVNRRLLEILLADLDCLAITAESGAQALDILAREHAAQALPDLVITDLQMPEMDGEQLGQAIKADPRFAHLPLVILTSIAMRGDAARLAKQHFAAYLTKPIKSSLLYQCLETVLGLAQKGEEAPIITRFTLSENRRTGHILLVEDNTTNQRVAAKILERLGHTCDIANNGIEALVCLAEKDYDLVLMDCQMPVMDGFEATRQIRDKQSPARIHEIPVIALTAHALQGDKEAVLAAGMDDYLPKPFDVELFDDTIDRWLRKRTAPHEVKGPGKVSARHAPVFDPEGMMSRFGGDLSMGAIMVQEGLVEISEQIAFLAQGLTTRDDDLMRRSAHAAKGLADSVGGLALCEICLRAEKMIIEQKYAEAEALMPEFQDQFAQLSEKATLWLSQQDGGETH